MKQATIPAAFTQILRRTGKTRELEGDNWLKKLENFVHYKGRHYLIAYYLDGQKIISLSITASNTREGLFYKGEYEVVLDYGGFIDVCESEALDLIHGILTKLAKLEY